MSVSATTILLLRHGHVEGIDPPRFRGRKNLTLTALGQRQTEALRDRIAAEWKPDAIHASPLGRCMRTAATIAGPFGLDAQSAPDLVDLDYGDWQGMTFPAVRSRWPAEWARWQENPELAVFPHGESLADLAKRATGALHAIIDSHRGQTVAVVAHDSVNRVLLLHAFGLPLSRYHALTQAPCCLNVLASERGRLNVHTLNETGHLRGL